MCEHSRAVMVDMLVELDRGNAARQHLGETLLALFARLSGLQRHVTFWPAGFSFGRRPLADIARTQKQAPVRIARAIPNKTLDLFSSNLDPLIKSQLPLPSD